jgi:hypothetical protein
MAYRYSWLAGTAALLFVLYQLNGLLKSTVDGTPWQLVVVAALILGVAITWTALAYRLPTWLAVIVNAIAAVIAIARVSAPETTWALLPTTATLDLLGTQLSQALDIVRNGIEPVIPVAGLVVMLLVLFWAIGFLFAWGLSKGHPYVALLPPLIIALQFATMDRQRTTALRATIFVSIVAGCLLAVALDQRKHGTGRMVALGEFETRKSRISRSSTGLLASIVVASVAVVSIFSSAVPADGILDWRSPTGLTGDFEGSIAYNPFISIKQTLVSFSDAPVFVAKVTGDVPADQIYFSLLTMETYSGGQFFASSPEVAHLEEDEWQVDGHRFAGPVDTVRADVEIKRLLTEWLPAPSVVTDFGADRKIEGSVRVRTDDGALRFEGGRTYDGMLYQVRADIPRPDIAVLATGSDGALSPAFVEAAKANEQVPSPAIAESREEPPDIETYLSLPDDLDTGVRLLARAQTRNLGTSFEKAIALESWFRSSAFRYSTDIVPGHGATDLADWLLEPSSPNYRTGYCENFATSMAVMARTIGIPSRVVLGFTPGTPQGDGTIVVLDRNAHAWVELWMPTQGWIRFDPTPRGDEFNPTTFEQVETLLGFPFTDYLDVPDPVAPDISVTPRGPQPFPPDDGFAPIGGGPTPERGFEIPGWILRTVPWLGLSLLLLGGIPVVKWWRRRRRIRRLRTGDIRAAWDEIVARLDDLGTPPSPADTPVEVASKVDAVMAPLAVVYSRSLYGSGVAATEELVGVAKTSFVQTEQRLATRHSRFERLVASYRIGSLLPRWWRRRSSRRRPDS